MRARAKLPVCLGFCLTTLAALTPASAVATFHEMLIREVYPGSSNDSYVELQMYAAGQNLVGGHSLSLYNASGALTKAFTFPADVPNGANQQTVLIGDTGVQTSFGSTPDLVDPDLNIPAAGAACWAGVIDCVAWGSFSGSVGSPVGSPVDPAGMAIRRTIAPGCATLLEARDDTNDSATDFTTVFPAPRSNSVTPTEHACQSDGGGNGRPPETRIRRKPRKRTRDRTPTFRFKSSEAGSSFECKLDRRPFVVCAASYTSPRLSFGRHRLQVRARDRSGSVDPSPASYAFKVVRRKR